MPTRSLLVLFCFRVTVALALCTSAAHAADVASTAISLPKGPASIEGLGRSFVPSLASGTAAYGVEIAVPPAAGGFGPNLSLDYDAGSGVSELGVGWHLGGVPAIRRRVEQGLPRFADTDAFELSGMGMPCDLLELEPGIYRPEYESGAFARVERSSDGARWQARLKNGQVLSFGGDGYGEQEGDHIATYLLREQRDRHGHVIRYEWDTSEGHALLRSVVWNDFGSSSRIQVQFSYEEQPNLYERFSSGIRQVISRRMVGIEVTYGAALVRRYSLGYGQGQHSRLASVELVGSDGQTRMPTLRLGYTEASLLADGQVLSMQNAPGRSPAEANVALVDLNGDSLPDLLVSEAGAYRSYINRDGVRWLPAADWAAAASPALTLATTGVQLADIDGDGAVDLVAKSGTEYFRYYPGLDDTSFAPAVTLSSIPNFTFEDPDVRLADMDGDRRADAVITTAAGLAIGYNRSGRDWTSPEPLGNVDPTQPLRFSDGGRTSLCDVNGDRVLDFCALRSESFVYWLGRGRGRFEPARAARGVPAFAQQSPWQLQDLDGDGWVDLVHVGVTGVEYALATGAGVFGEARSISGTPQRTPNVSVHFADMNGSGTLDIVWVDTQATGDMAWRYLELFPRGRAGLLESIDNGLGKVVHIAYEPAASQAARARDAGHPWSTRMNVGMPVVRRVEVTTSLAEPALVSEYTYRNGTWDAQDRTFAGFAAGISTQVGDEYTPTLVVEDTFDTGLAQRVLRGAPLTSERRSERGDVFSRTSYAYSILSLGSARDGRVVQYGYRSSERVEHIEAGSGAPPRATLSEWLQDSYGNVLEERRWGEVVEGDALAGDDEAITQRTYANDSERWLLGFPASETLTNAAGQRLRAKRWYYDGEPFEGLPLGQITQGDVTRQEVWTGPGEAAFVLDTATHYNDHGQPLETRDARGGGRIFQWDAEHPASLESETVKLEGDAKLIEVAEVDPRFGNLLSVQEYNGQTTRFQYDALGRLSAVIKPGDTTEAPSIRYVYTTEAPLSRVVTDSRVSAPGVSPEFEHHEALFDGSGRQRASLTRAEGGQWVLAGVDLLDARGSARRSLRPRFIAEAEVAAPPVLQDGLGTSAWRDALGRTVRTRSELGLESRSEYAPFSVRSWDGAQTDLDSPYEHTPIVHDVDGLGRSIRAAQRLNGSELSAVFSYDAAGQLLTKTDPEGHVARYTYDGRGNRTLVDDPDLGQRVLVYDAAGNLIERHNPDGSVLTYSFDLAGRPTSEDWDADGTPEVVKTWDLHPDAPNDPRYRGKLAHITEPTGTTDHVYDERGRIIETRVTLEGSRYTSGSRYDNLDREALHIYPDGSSIAIERNARGQLAGYGTGAVRIDYAGDGVESKRHFSSGVLQQSAYDADRRLTELEASDAAGNAIEHLSWSFDGAGNVTSIRDLRPGITNETSRSESYQYDNLYRLRAASGGWGEARWAYSASGNLTQRNGPFASQATDIRYEGSAPHAPTRIGQRSIVYDALGRMLHDGERTYTWNTADQLTHVSTAQGAEVENQFDASGIRRIRSEKTAEGNTSKVLFISPWSEIRDGELIRYIVHAGRRIVRLAEDNGVAASAIRASADKPGPLLLPLLLLAKTGTLPVLLALAIALLWQLRRVLQRSARALAPVAALAIAAACAGSNDDPRSADDTATIDLEGSVHTLTEADTLLINDPLGSLLAETNGYGEVQGRFAAYPYGVTRADTSRETRRYTGATRDTAIGLDLMGARFYAPDLGVWTSGDPIAINTPEQSATEQFGTANPYAYANLNPTTATDPDGEFWHIAIGAGIGALVGGGMEAAKQYYATGHIEDWGRVAAAAGGGAVSGAITAAVPTVGVGAFVAVNGGASAANGLAQRLIASGGKDAGTLTDVVVDATVGVATAGVFRGAGALIKRAAGARAPAGQIKALDSEGAVKGAAASTGEAGPTLRFSQTTASRAFDTEGNFAGRTIGSLAADLRAGAVHPSAVPVKYVTIDGNNLIVNTRSSLALTRAGVPQSRWTLIDATVTDAAHIQERLLRNELTSEGTSVLRITGLGSASSSLE